MLWMRTRTSTHGTSPSGHAISRSSESPRHRAITSNHVGPKRRSGAPPGGRVSHALPQRSASASMIETPVPAGSGAVIQRCPKRSSSSATRPSFAAWIRIARLPSSTQWRRVLGPWMGSHSASGSASWSASYSKYGTPSRFAHAP